MTIEKLLKDLDGFSDSEREKWILSLMKKFCTLSSNQVENFQSEWMRKHPPYEGDPPPFEEFKAGQNKVIKECIEIEISEIGKGVRKVAGLEPLSLSTEL